MRAASAVRLLGRCLGARRDPGLAEALSRPGVCAAVVETANRALLTPALAAALGDRRLLDGLGAPLQTYLEDVATLNAARNAALRTQLERVLDRLGAAKVPAVVLKGGLWLVHPGLDAGRRMLTDLDLLVPATSLHRAVAALESAGYRPAPNDVPSPPHLHHHPPLMKPGEPATIELHRELLYPPGDRALPAAGALTRARPVGPGGGPLRLDPTDHALHAVLHAQVMDRALLEGRLPLRALVELASLRQAGEGVDWAAAERRMHATGWAHAWRAHLAQTRDLLGMPLPDGVRVGTRARLHLSQCWLQLRYGALDRLARSWGEKLAAERMRALYACGTRPAALDATRLRHMARVALRLASPAQR